MKKVKAIATKGLTRDLINKFSVLNGAKYFSLGTFRIMPVIKYIFSCYYYNLFVEV